MTAEAPTMEMPRGDTRPTGDGAPRTARPIVGVFEPTAHPLLPLPTRAELERVLQRADGAKWLAEFYQTRERLIRLSEEEPYRHGFELDHWKDADELLKTVDLLIIFGGNRASKSEYAAKRIVSVPLTYPESVTICLHESDETSIATQQKMIWKYLPQEIKALNERRHSVYKIKYSQAGGFTEGKVVFPNRSELYFVSYKQDPGSFEGWELGAKQAEAIGVWADENMPLPWLKMLLFRLASRAGKLIWTYAPVKGLTPTIKEAVGNAPITLKSRFAELLPNRVNVPGLPTGHMPYVQVPFMSNARVIYFHSILNPFGKHYSQIKKLCEGRSSNFIEQRAYGYARDTGWRAFPLFGEWNIVKREHLPAEGTNYQLVDPAGARNWASIWWRVAPGNPAKHYIYRDWPDYHRYGEWAITSNNPNKFDGDPGPAQNTLGYGPEEYKKLFLREETIKPLFEGGRIAERDPYRRALVEEALKGAGIQPRMDTDGHGLWGEEAWRDPCLEVLSETVRYRYIDPRAGSNQHAAEKGGTCLIDKLAQEQRSEKGEVVPRMVFLPASGVRIDEGLNLINMLLFWDRDQPMDMVTNAPQLYVCEDCKNVIWALQHWTGLDGETGACKDFVDLVRYGALEELRYLEPGAVRTRGGGSY